MSKTTSSLFLTLIITQILTLKSLSKSETNLSSQMPSDYLLSMPTAFRNPNTAIQKPKPEILKKEKTKLSKDLDFSLFKTYKADLIDLDELEKKTILPQNENLEDNQKIGFKKFNAKVDKERSLSESEESEEESVDSSLDTLTIKHPKSKVLKEFDEENFVRILFNFLVLLCLY